MFIPLSPVFPLSPLSDFHLLGFGGNLACAGAIDYSSDGIPDEGSDEVWHLLHVVGEGAAALAHQHGSVLHDVPVEHCREQGNDESPDAEGAHVAVVQPEMQGGVSCERAEWDGEHYGSPGQLARFHIQSLLLPCGENTG